ncbi:MAG: 16S rRNA (cytosine(967)-C(5))-methyltransferase RsmB [Actinomycetota bacterium]
MAAVGGARGRGQDAVTTARTVALDALIRIEDGAYSHILVPSMLGRTDLAARERAFVTELVYGTVRMQRALDHQLSAVSSQPISNLEPIVRAALRLGAYQLLQKVPAHAAVGETVGAVPQRARGYVNGVLRAMARRGPPWPWPAPDDTEGIGIRTSHPDWIVRTLVDDFGRPDALATLAGNDEPPRVTLRVNPLRSTPDAAARELEEAGIGVERGTIAPDAFVLRGAGDIGALALVADGRVTPQDQASQVVIAALDPQPGERVLDVAAAPGGKATATAELMRDQGSVTATDLHPGRVRTIARAAARLGLQSIAPVVADGRRLPLAPAVMDRVLLDAPCSGLGVLRRRADARWHIRERDVDDLARLQRELLVAASAAVRPGGRLVYSVCTLTRAETIGVDEFATGALANFRAVDPPGSPWRPHGRGALLLPSDVGTDGMFVLVLQRDV